MTASPSILELIDESTGTVLANDVVVDLLRCGEGPPLLLLHGVEGVGQDESLIAELAQHHTVIVPSHPGFGLSPMPKWLNSIEDLAYLYLDLLSREELENVTVVGLQFGGWIAAEMAVRDCSRIGSLILVDSVGIKVGGREERDIADVFALSRDQVNALTFADPEKNPLKDLHAASREDVLHLARNEEALVPFVWQPYMHNPKLMRWLIRIPVRTRVIWGAQDGIVPPDYGRAFSAAIPGSSFHLVEDAGHRPQVEQPQTVAAIITAND
ncbi:alpha/beta fold hydrolase [Arthrobacter sp. RHLT1-20]